MRSRLIKILLIIAAIWFGMTCAVDFLALPSIFRTVTNIEQAGAVGMKVFGSFNKIEVFCGGIIFSLIVLIRPIQKLLTLFSSGLLIIACGYNFYLTPKIAELSRAMRKANIPVETLNALENIHSEYHQLYIRLDSLKLLLLLLLISFLFFYKEKNKQKEGLI